jgi:hypothetical protein
MALTKKALLLSRPEALLLNVMWNFFGFYPGAREEIRRALKSEFPDVTAIEETLYNNLNHLIHDGESWCVDPTCELGKSKPTDEKGPVPAQGV